jgi:hypothetical protein
MAAEVQLPDGNTMKVPDFALEKTQMQMHDLIKQLVKNNDKAVSAYNELIDETKDAASKNESQNEELIKAHGKLQSTLGKDFRTNFADRIEGDLEGVFGFAGKAIGSFAGALVGVAGFLQGVFLGVMGAYETLGQQYDQVREAGVGFIDRFGGSITDAVTGLHGLGMTAEQTTKLLAEFSRTTAIVGKGRIPALSRQFLALTNSGMALGMTQTDAINAMAREIQLRSQMYDISKLSSAELAASAAQQIKMQQKYASALGISAEELAKSSADAISSNLDLQLAMIELGPKVADQARNFMTAFTAMGGGSEAAKGFANAMITASSSATGFATQSGRELLQLSQALGSAGQNDLAGLIQKTQQEMAAGSLNGEALAERMRQMSLAVEGNPAARRVLQTLIESGNSQASNFVSMFQDLKTYGNTVRNGAQAAIEPFYQATQSARNLNAQINTTFEQIKMSLLSLAGPFVQAFSAALIGEGGLLIAFKDAISTITEALFGVAATEGNVGELTDKLKSLAPMVREFGQSVADLINSIKETMAKYSTKDLDGDGTLDMDWKGLFTDLFKQMIIGAIKAIPELISNAFGFIVELFSNSETRNALLLGIGLLFGAGVVKAAVAAAFTSFMGNVGTKLFQKMFSKTPALPGGAPGTPSTPGGGPSPRPSPGRPGINPAASAADRRSGGMMASLGGGMKRLAAGLKAIGSPAAMRGAVTIGILVAGVYGLAKAGQEFNTVEWSSLGKIGLAAGGLVATAAAISLLGPALGTAAVPFAIFSAASILLVPIVLALGKAFQWMGEGLGAVAPLMKAAMDGLQPVFEGVKAFMENFENNIGALGGAISTVVTSIGESVGSVVTAVGNAISGIVTTIADGISKIINSFAENDVMRMNAQVDAIKQLAAIPNGQIDTTTASITRLGAAMEAFMDQAGGGIGDRLLGRNNFIAQQISFFNQLSDLDVESINTSGSTITNFTNVLKNYAKVDINAIRNVNAAVRDIAAAHIQLAESMARVSQIDPNRVANIGRAIMIYNAAAQGEIIVPTESGDSVSRLVDYFTKASVANTERQTGTTDANGNVTRPETGQQKMIRLLENIDSRSATTNTRLTELIDETKKRS